MRRNMSPANFSSPIQHRGGCVSGAAQRVAYETRAGAREVSIHQQMWVLEGTIEVTVGEVDLSACPKTIAWRCSSTGRSRFAIARAKPARIWWSSRPNADDDQEMILADRIPLPAALDEREIQGLGDVLIDCVEGGASVSFMHPMTREKADRFWRSISASAASGERLVLIAEDDVGIVGTVQVVFDMPENQPHRGDVAKMLVHRRARRLGVGAALLAAAERSALEAGKTLLVLDTASGDAERLYARQGWQRCGYIPNYALMPDGAPCATTIFFKALSG